MTALNLEYLTPTKPSFKNNQPFSEQFNDVYFNDDGGLQETEFVFIQHNHLIDRWQASAQQASFCIAETGFGTGLNFLTVCQKWQQLAAKPRHLHFISFEKHPLSLESLQKAHSCFPELALLSNRLSSLWGSFRTGIHRLNFSHDITLSLVFGDANSYIDQIHAQVDAWFLDGFAPKKNPELWQDALFTHINRLSKPGTTLSTYTAASEVKKALSGNGFKVTKVPGFGKKREMITAQYESSTFVPTKAHLWDPLPQQKSSSRQVSILGGGIAGMCLARQFKLAGFETTVIDQDDQPMRQASGNELAMVMPLLTAQNSPESLFYSRAFESALQFYTETEFHPIGVQQDLINAKQIRWAQTIQALNLPTELLTITATNPAAAVYSQAGYVDTKQVANRLLQDVDHWITADVQKLGQDDKGQWQLFNQQQEIIHSTDLLIVAAGMKSQQLLNPIDLSLTAKHGQTTTIQAPESYSLDSIQLHKGYIIPAADQHQWLCGATFDHVNESHRYQKAQLAADHWQRNSAFWQDHPLQQHLKSATVLGGFAAIRATTPDHLPICGPIINQNQFRIDCHDLHHGRHWQDYPPAICTDNLYVLSGLGSRGYTSAPLLASYLSSMILAEPLPLEADLCKIIHPNRFLYRNLKKRIHNS